MKGFNYIHWPVFPIVFEGFVWILYVWFYRYGYYLNLSGLPPIPGNNFPYPAISMYSVSSALYLLPYSHYIAPKLLWKKKYGLLLLLSIGYFILLGRINDLLLAHIWTSFAEDQPVYSFFFHLPAQGRRLDLLLTDFIAFFAIAFAHFSYRNEIVRKKMENDNLRLQLQVLKTQLQPHFLFNTLNSLYGMSLSGNKNTSHFIFQLSQMMQYILYESDREYVNLRDEIGFLKTYFDLEQQKFPKAIIHFRIMGAPIDQIAMKVPPLLFLPLVENSFKYGKHKIEDGAHVEALLDIDKEQVIFTIRNDKIRQEAWPKNLIAPGGIGLDNLKKRLILYYPAKHNLQITEDEKQYRVLLKINYR